MRRRSGIHNAEGDVYRVLVVDQQVMNCCHLGGQRLVLECAGWLVSLHFVRRTCVDGTRIIRVALFQHG